MQLKKKKILKKNYSFKFKQGVVLKNKEISITEMFQQWPAAQAITNSFGVVEVWPETPVWSVTDYRLQGGRSILSIKSLGLCLDPTIEYSEGVITRADLITASSWGQRIDFTDIYNVHSTKKETKETKPIIHDFGKYRGATYSFSNPTSKLDNYVLAMFLWKDIFLKGYKYKDQSKYYKYVEEMQCNCPLCDVHINCDGCALENCTTGSLHSKFLKDGGGKYSNHIYQKIKISVDSMIDDLKEKSFGEDMVEAKGVICGKYNLEFSTERDTEQSNTLYELIKTHLKKDFVLVEKKD
jgi:hypothetical protein